MYKDIYLRKNRIEEGRKKRSELLKGAREKNSARSEDVKDIL